MVSEGKISRAARELSKLGAKKGGRARASVLTKEERKEIASKAAKARWKKEGKLKETPQGRPKSEAKKKEKATEPERIEMPYSMFRGELEIGDIKMECHVLNDLRRVFTQREVVRFLSAGRKSGDLGIYLDNNPLINKDEVLAETFSFKIPGTQFEAIAYEATLIVDICGKYIEAKEQGELRTSQYKLAAQSQIFMRSSAKVGIIALIDEATGYQELRAKRALQLKLQAFIADEMQDWAKMFPDDFWFELARIEGVRYSPRNRPLRWGKYIMMFVYDAIDSDIGKALREKNPDPHFRKNHHQWLKEFGKEKVKLQIQSVTTIMKLCKDMNEFKHKFNKVFSKGPVQIDLFADIQYANNMT